jgi:uncharacterized repeat protein (TIGR01451 family)
MFYRKTPILNTIKNCLAFVLGTAFITPVYSLTFSYVPGTEVELLPSVESSFRSPNDINASGDVVGSADYNWAFRAVLWPADGSAPVRLDNSNEFDETNSSANAINDQGDIVGNFKGATLWVNQQPTKLSPGGVVSDINNNGLIVGRSNALTPENRAVVWDNLNISLLGGEPAGLGSLATSVNNAGDVGGVYYSTDNYQSVYAPVVWRNGQMIDLGKLPGFEKQAYVNDLNDFDQVVGSSTATGPSPNSSRAVIWESGLVAHLGTLGGEYSTAVKINNNAQIVGSSTVSPGEHYTASSVVHPVLWQNGVMYDLAPAVNMSCNSSSKCLGHAKSINDSGQIAISVTDANGHNSYRLTITDLSQLPSVSAPLNFVTPVGADGSNPFVVDLALTMQASPDPVQVDELLTYDINVTNNGGIPAHNASVDIPISNDVTFVSVTNSAHILVCTNYISSGRGKDKTPRTTRVLCNFGTLDIGFTENIQLVVQPNSGGTISRTVTATSDEDDNDTSDNSVTVTTTVEGGDSGGGGSKPCKGKKCN